MDKYEKIEALKDNVAFQQELAAVDSLEGLQEVLLNHGVELTNEELQQMVAMAEKQGELSDADLDNVTGGAFVGAWLLRWIIKNTPVLLPRLPRRK